MNTVRKQVGSEEQKSKDMKDAKPQATLTALRKEKTTKMYFRYYFSVWSVANVARMNVKQFKWNGV